MKTSTTFLLVALLGLTGCESTQLVGRRVTTTPAEPYRKVLACSMDTEAYRRVLEEAAVKGELNKRAMEAKTCSEFFSDMRALSDAQVRSRFELAGFDAVLAWHRRPIVQTFDGRAKGAAEHRSLTGLLQAYRRRALERSEDAVRSDEGAQLSIQEGQQRVEQGEVYVFDARSGLPVWEGRGAVLGSPDEPAEIGVNAMVKTAVQAFFKDGLIPRS